MPGSNYSHTTRATGLTLTASIYNSDHTQHITSLIPTTMDDYSASLAEMRTQTDPFPASSESQATSMAGELARIRYVLDQIIGAASGRWYADVPTDLTAVSTGGFSWAMDGVLLVNGTDTDHDIDVTYDAVALSDNGDADGMLKQVVNGSSTIQIDIAAGINSIDTGAVANNTFYYIWLLNGSTGTGLVFSTATAFASVTKPTGYDTSGRMIGVVRTDGSANIRNFTHQKGGNYYRYDNPVQDVNDGTITSNTAETATLTAPPDTLVHVRLHVINTNEDQVYGLVRPVGAADTTANIDESSVGAKFPGGATPNMTGEAWVPVDGSSQCEYMAEEAQGTTTVIINTIGFWFYL